MTITYVDRIGTLPVLAVAYSLGDPTITLDFCPADVLTKGPEFPCSLNGILFRVTAVGGGNVVWSVTRDPRTADVAQVIGTPVLVQFAGWQLEELRDRPIEETLTAETDTTLVLAPDGAGGVEFRAETGGTTITALDDVPDVNAPAPGDGDVLTWDSTPGEWVAQAPAAVPSALDDLTDVNAPSPADRDVLLWDDGAGEWISDQVDWADLTGKPTLPTYTLTNVTTDRAYDANATTTDELADVLGTLIDDLGVAGMGGGGGAPTAHGCRVKRASGNVSLSGTTVIPFTAEDDDTDAYHDNSTNPSRLTVPSGLAGVYSIFGGGYTDAGSDISIRVNGSTVIAFGRAGAGASSLNSYIASTMYRLAVGDYVELLYTPQGASVLIYDAANASPHFGMYLVGA